MPPPSAWPFKDEKVVVCPLFPLERRSRVSARPAKCGFGSTSVTGGRATRSLHRGRSASTRYRPASVLSPRVLWRRGVRACGPLAISPALRRGQLSVHAPNEGVPLVTLWRIAPALAFLGPADSSISAAPSTHSQPISRTRWITARPGRRAGATPMPCAPHPPYPLPHQPQRRVHAQTPREIDTQRLLALTMHRPASLRSDRWSSWRGLPGRLPTGLGGRIQWNPQSFE